MTIQSILNRVRSISRTHRETLRKQKLEQLFQVKNRVVQLRTGKVFEVLEVDFGSAFLMDDRGLPSKALWLSSAGRLRTEVADQWELAR